MNEPMPRTPFSTPLSGSAKETELRLCNIFSGPKKRPPVLFLALVFAVCIFCGNLVSCQMAEVERPDRSAPEENPSAPEGPPAEEWINYLGRTPEDFPWDDSADLELPEYPGVTFRWMPGNLCAITIDVDCVTNVQLFTGVPIWNVFLCDLNGDGLRELCATASFVSELRTDSRIKVFDYAAGERYILQSHRLFDYTLSLEDGQLQVTKSRCQGQPLAVGSLAIQDGVLRMVDEVPILDSSAPDLAYLLTREYDTFPDSAEYMSSQLLLSREGEGCTLALALVSGGPHVAGLGNLMLGLWDQSAQSWRGPVYTVGGDDGLFSSWTGADGSLHILCANTTTYQGDEDFCDAAYFRFDGTTLEERNRWNTSALGEDIKMVPIEGGMEIYERNPQYDLQHYNPEYDGAPLPDQWIYSHFEPVTD